MMILFIRKYCCDLHETRNLFYTCHFFHRPPYFFSTTENAHANLARRLSLTYKFSEKSTIGASGKERKYPAGSRNRLGGRTSVHETLISIRYYTPRIFIRVALDGRGGNLSVDNIFF